MKILYKKIGAMVLVVTLAATALVGCPARERENNTSQSSSASGDEPIVIKAVMKEMSPDDPIASKYAETVSQKVSEKLGKDITLELVSISDGSYSESVGLLLQSGAIPDLIYFQGGDYQFAITQEILEDLIPYIEGSEYIKATMQPFNEKRMENYPYLLWLAPDRVKVPVVRTDWFEATESGKTLISDPSPANYKAFFEELKTKNNLQAAFTAPGDLTELDTIFDLAFGVSQTWVKQEGSYVYSKISNASKEKLAFYTELYQAGLLDKEYLSKKWDTKESAFYNGEVGVVSGTQGGVINIYDTKMVGQNGEESKLMVLPPAKGIGQGYSPSAINKESRGWAISAYSENKSEAFAILEYMASPEGQIFDKLGYEGEHYNIVEEKYVLTDKVSEWYARFHESTKSFEVEISEETPFLTPVALESLRVVKEYTTFDNNFVLPDEYVTNWDAGESLYAEYAADVISGKKSIDTFEDFVGEWYELGGDGITAYANEVIE